MMNSKTSGFSSDDTDIVICDEYGDDSVRPLEPMLRIHAEKLQKLIRDSEKEADMKEGKRQNTTEE